MNREEKMKSVFSIYVVLLPIIQYYNSPLPGLNLATFLATVWFVVFAVHSRGKLKLQKRLIPVNLYVAWLVFDMLLMWIVYDYSVSELNIANFLRIMLLMISILYLGTPYFDINRAMSFLEKLLIASTFYMVVQHGARELLNLTLLSTIPVLIRKESYMNASLRTSGFFMEPAGFAQACMIYLSFRLFAKQRWEKKDYYKIAIIVFGLILSGSGQGYALLAVVFALFYLERFSHRSMSRKRMILLLALFVVLLITVAVVSVTPYGQYALNRIYLNRNGEVSFGGQALAGRTYTNKLFYALDSSQKLWGLGAGSAGRITTGYVNSLFFYLLEGGYVVIGVWVLMLISVFRRGNTGVRVYCILFSLLFSFTGCGRAMMMCHEFPFMLNGIDYGKDDAETAASGGEPHE